jgi:heat shock protein HslJ
MRIVYRGTHTMNPPRPLLRSLSQAALLSLPILIAGCVDKGKEFEPRVDTRPMVDEIQQAEEDWNWIAGQQWFLVTIEGRAPIAGTTINLNFKQHTWLEGDAGCNRFTANYTRKADAGLQITEVLSTRMFCAEPEGIMQQESRFFHLLRTVDAYHAEPKELDLLSNGAIVLSLMILEDEKTP